MKTPSDDLFNLIKSLSSEEKRQFKLFSQHNSEQAIYLKLFDSIDTLKLYDEKRLLTILHKKTGTNHIKYVKRYLQEALFRFLEYHYSDNSIEVQLQRLLQRIEILCDKKLVVFAHKLILKAEKIAIENHQYLYLLNILSLKKRIMILEETTQTHEEYEQDLYRKEIHYMNLYKNIVKYKKIDIQVGDILITQFENTDKDTRSALKKILRHPYLKNEQRALSPKAKAIYYMILGDIYMMLKNPEKSYACFRQLVSFFESAKLKVHEKLNAYARLSTLLHTLKKHNELLQVKHNIVYLFKYLPAKQLTANLQSRYLSIMVNYIDYQLSAFNVKEALSTSDEIQRNVEKQASTQTFLVYYINKLLIYFYLSDYRKALKCANKILLNEKNAIRRDIISDVKILYLVLHYESSDDEALLPDLCRSTMRYFNRQKQPHPVERIMIRFFDKAIRKVDAKKTKEITFSKLIKELDQYRSESILSNFNFIFWAESKIQNRPMIEILREKAFSAHQQSAPKTKKHLRNS